MMGMPPGGIPTPSTSDVPATARPNVSTASVSMSSRTTPSTSSVPTSFSASSVPSGPRMGAFLPINLPPGRTGHVDPLVPCESFHFGPNFQHGLGREHPHLVAEVSSIVIEHGPRGSRVVSSTGEQPSQQPANPGSGQG